MSDNFPFLPFLFLNFLLVCLGQVVIDNEIIAGPQIQCRNRSIVFIVQTKNPFRGNIYVKGQFGVTRCRKEFYLNNLPEASFEIAHGDCGMLKVRQLQPQGLAYTLEVMTSFHPRFVTKVDRGFNVNCFYAQTPRPVEAELQVQPLQSMQLDQSTMVWPSCHYTIRSETMEGPVARTVEVGDLIIHRWQCDNPNFGMLVKNCVVSDGGSSTELVLDERGCPTKTSVIQGELAYDNTLTMAFAKVNAFSFPDRSILNFRCQIQVCNKDENECLGVSPPNCPKINVQDYLPNSIVNPNVNPTEVIGIFEPPFPTPSQFGQNGGIDANQLPFQPLLPTQYPQQPIFPAPFQQNSNSFSYDPTVFAEANARNEHIGPYFRHSASSARRAPSSNEQIMQSNSENQRNTTELPILQVLNRPSKLPLTSPSDLFKKISSDSSTLTAHQSTPSAKMQRTPWRSKRAEDETLDVVAEPVHIVEFSRDSSEDGVGNNNNIRKHSQNRQEIVIGKNAPDYCVDRSGLITLIVFFVILSCICITTTVYILYDTAIGRNKKRKDMSPSTTNRDPFAALDSTINSYHFHRTQDLPFSFSRLTNSNSQN